MYVEIRVSAISPEELSTIAAFLSSMMADKAGAVGPSRSTGDETDRDFEGPDSSETRESTRERGLAKFQKWAQICGLEVRRSQPEEGGTFIVSDGTKERPVEVICSTKPRITLRRKWAQPPNLVLAYVYLENDQVLVSTYGKIDRILAGAAFTSDGFYTKAVSPGAVITLMETGAFGNSWEAIDYISETGFSSDSR